MLTTLPMLQTRYRAALVLGVLLPAYLLVVCGLFSWLPVLWFGQQHHQFETADKGATVEWVIHHGHEQSSPIADSHADDHTLTLPCADEVKQSIPLIKLLLLVPLLLWCWCYFAWSVYPRFRAVDFPAVPILCRNSLIAMTRTIVLRH
ncbi:MAG: hypothetical protein Q7U16_07290 [Agitococcus sp.]|nr:hypothetical protein [Agitococcus sp.]